MLHTLLLLSPTSSLVRSLAHTEKNTLVFGKNVKSCLGKKLLPDYFLKPLAESWKLEEGVLFRSLQLIRHHACALCLSQSVATRLVLEPSQISRDHQRGKISTRFASLPPDLSQSNHRNRLEEPVIESCRFQSRSQVKVSDWIGASWTLVLRSILQLSPLDNQ